MSKHTENEREKERESVSWRELLVVKGKGGKKTERVRVPKDGPKTSGRRSASVRGDGCCFATALMALESIREIDRSKRCTCSHARVSECLHVLRVQTSGEGLGTYLGQKETLHERAAALVGDVRDREQLAAQERQRFVRELVRLQELAHVLQLRSHKHEAHAVSREKLQSVSSGHWRWRWRA
jgi:hypothetical protein